MFTRWDLTAKPALKTISATGNPGTRETGITLIEVTVALAILAMLIGLAAVSFKGMDQEQDLTRTAATLRELAGKARRTAISEGRPVELEIRAQTVVARDRTLRLSDSHLQIRRWGSGGWETARGYRWRFEPNGICEPISLRVVRGEASYEMTFHPLTALAEDERLWIP